MPEKATRQYEILATNFDSEELSQEIPFFIKKENKNNKYAVVFFKKKVSKEDSNQDSSGYFMSEEKYNNILKGHVRALEEAESEAARSVAYGNILSNAIVEKLLKAKGLILPDAPSKCKMFNSYGIEPVPKRTTDYRILQQLSEFLESEIGEGPFLVQFSPPDEADAKAFERMVGEIFGGVPKGVGSFLDEVMAYTAPVVFGYSITTGRNFSGKLPGASLSSHGREGPPETSYLIIEQDIYRLYEGGAAEEIFRDMQPLSGYGWAVVSNKDK